MRCGIIAPRQRALVGERDDGYLAECILKKLHQGPHCIKTPEGKYFIWENDYNCDCCGPEEEDRCYTHGEIKEGNEILKQVE